jgi:hypothetical protein
MHLSKKCALHKLISEVSIEYTTMYVRMYIFMYVCMYKYLILDDLLFNELGPYHLKAVSNKIYTHTYIHT